MWLNSTSVSMTKQTLEIKRTRLRRFAARLWLKQKWSPCIVYTVYTHTQYYTTTTARRPAIYTAEIIFIILPRSVSVTADNPRDSKQWSLVTGHWSLVTGYWILVTDQARRLRRDVSSMAPAPAESLVSEFSLSLRIFLIFLQHLTPAILPTVFS